MGLRTQSRLFWFLQLLRHKCGKFIACHILIFTLFYMPGCFSMALKQYVPHSVATEWHWRLFHSRLRGSIAKKPWHLAQIPFVTSLHTADRWTIKRTNERMNGGIFPVPVYFDMPTMMPFCLSCDRSLRVCTETDLSAIVYPIVRAVIVHSAPPVVFIPYSIHTRFKSYPWFQVLFFSQTFCNPGTERTTCSVLDNEKAIFSLSNIYQIPLIMVLTPGQGERTVLIML